MSYLLVMVPQISIVREPQPLLCPSAMGLNFIMDRVLASGAAFSSVCPQLPALRDGWDPLSTDK